MAPKQRGAKTDTTNDSDNDKKPSWDSNDRNLKLWLLHLKRWLPLQLKHFNNFIRYAYTINARQETVVFDNDHSDKLTKGSLEGGTFEAPCMISNADGDASEDEYDDEDDESSEDSGEEREASPIRPTEPLSAARIRRASTPRTKKDGNHKIAIRSSLL